MKELQKVKLCELVNFQTGPFGTQFSASEYVEKGIPVINVKNIGIGKIIDDNLDFISETTRERLSQHILHEGDIVFGRKGSVDRHAYVFLDEDGWVQGSDCIRARGKVRVNMLFLSQYLEGKSVKKQIMDSAVGSTMPSLNTDILKDIFVLLPSIKEQNKISSVLHAISKKISVNEKINDNLEQQAKLIYDYWFTQFDFPDKNGKPYCSSGGKMVWNEQLKRNIPENWNVIPLLKLVSWESNSQPPKSEFVYEPKEGYVRFIQNRDYDSDTHITYIPRTKNLSIVDRFDILMDKYGDAGAVRYGIEGAFNVALGKICVHNPNYREYIRSFLGSDGIYKFLHNSCMASTRASLSEANLEILNVVVPDEKIILDYENFLHKIRVSILKNKDETVELINLRDWLLPMLMNGQATISD